MKKWSWLLAMVLGVGMMVCVGCEDDDDDEEAGTTTTVVTNVVNGATVVVTNTTSGGTSGGTTSGGTTSGGTTSGETTSGETGNGETTAPTDQEVINRSFSLQQGQVFQAQAPIPAAGSIYYDVQWVAFDELDNSQIPVSLFIECNVTGGGVYDSPYGNTISQIAGGAAGVYIRNDNFGARAEGTVNAHWYPE